MSIASRTTLSNILGVFASFRNPVNDTDSARNTLSLEGKEEDILDPQIRSKFCKRIDPLTTQRRKDSANGTYFSTLHLPARP